MLLRFSNNVWKFVRYLRARATLILTGSCILTDITLEWFYTGCLLILLEVDYKEAYRVMKKIL